MGVRNVFEIIQVEMKAKGGENDAKDGKECLFGEEEIRIHEDKGGEKFLIGDPVFWMKDENIFAVYLFHEETRRVGKENCSKDCERSSEQIQAESK